MYGNLSKSLSTSCVLLATWPLLLRLPAWLLSISCVLAAGRLLPVNVFFPCYFLSPATFCLLLFPVILPVCDYFQYYFLYVHFLFHFLCLSRCMATTCLCLLQHHASCHSYFLSVSTTHPWLLPVSQRCVSCLQEETDWQWRQAMDYLSAVSELNYMTQIVIMLYEDNDKVGGALLLPPP